MKQNNQKPKVEFSNTTTYGDQIKALVRYYTGQSINTFVLEKALEEVKANNKKLDDLKKELLEVSE